MTEEEIRERVYNKYGNIEFELINFGKTKEPVVYKCLNCGKIKTLQRLDRLYDKDRVYFCDCYRSQEKNSDKAKIKNNFNRLPIEESQKRLDEFFDGEYVILEEKYHGWSVKSLVKHTTCGKIFSCKPRELLYHKHCPCITRNSKGEERIKKFLEKNQINFEEQKRLDNIRKAPYDFYLPDYNLLIEFQGRQHYEPVKAFGGEKQLLIQKEIDERKKKIAEEQNYNIFYISYKQMSLIEEILVQRLSLKGVDLSESKSQLPQKED